MCGNFGFAGDFFSRHHDAFKDLMVINSLRGKDSTGLAAINRNGDTEVFKKPVGPWELIEHPQINHLFNVTTNRVLIGHGRKATVGKKTVWNAHPFQFEHVVGTHNGTLEYRSRKLLNGYESEHETDSESIYHTINDIGINETVGRLKGAWAMVWWDKRDERIHMLRNKERSLYMCYCDDQKMLAWSSEREMLEFALDRNGINHEEIYYIPENELFSWKIPKASGAKIGKPTAKKMEGGDKKFFRPAPPATTGHYGAATTRPGVRTGSDREPLFPTYGNRGHFSQQSGETPRSFVETMETHQKGDSSPTLLPFPPDPKLWSQALKDALDGVDPDEEVFKPITAEEVARTAAAKVVDMAKERKARLAKGFTKYEKYNNRSIMKKQDVEHALAKNACACCDNTGFTWGDEVHFIDPEGAFVCKECWETDETTRTFYSSK